MLEVLLLHVAPPLMITVSLILVALAALSWHCIKYSYVITVGPIFQEKQVYLLLLEFEYIHIPFLPSVYM